jgi:hypothetical protein
MCKAICLPVLKYVYIYIMQPSQRTRHESMRDERHESARAHARRSETRLVHGMLLRDQSAMLLSTMLLDSMIQRDDRTTRHLAHLTPIILSHSISMPPQLHEIAITRTRKHFGILRLTLDRIKKRMFSVASLQMLAASLLHRFKLLN